VEDKMDAEKIKEAVKSYGLDAKLIPVKVKPKTMPLPLFESIFENIHDIRLKTKTSTSRRPCYTKRAEWFGHQRIETWVKSNGIMNYMASSPDRFYYDGDNKKEKKRVSFFEWSGVRVAYNKKEGGYVVLLEDAQHFLNTDNFQETEESDFTWFRYGDRRNRVSRGQVKANEDWDKARPSLLALGRECRKVSAKYKIKNFTYMKFITNDKYPVKERQAVAELAQTSLNARMEYFTKMGNKKSIAETKEALDKLSGVINLDTKTKAPKKKTSNGARA
jgi:hypothetical protein